MQDRQDRDALAEIARIATEAVAARGSSTTQTTDGDAAAIPPAPAAADLGCYVKALPDRLATRAAANATRINPVNSPLRAPLGSNLANVLEPQHIALLTTKYWGPQARTLSVSFLEATDADLRARIVSHLNAWSDTSGITFVETGGVGEVRISRGGGGYYSYLGTDVLLIPQNQQTMNLQGFTMNTPESEYHRVIRHEAGHTLGFPHEHMRKELVQLIDPVKAYAYFLATQGWDSTTVDQQVLTPLNDASLYGTPPDQDSIMCYQLPGSITYSGEPIRGGLDINFSDAWFAGLIYPKAGVFTTRQPSVTGDWAEADDVPDDQLSQRVAQLNSH